MHKNAIKHAQLLDLYSDKQKLYIGFRFSRSVLIYSLGVFYKGHLYKGIPTSNLLMWTRKILAE